ncbi:hypothetical protein DPMN_098685 [Dreissena polymorpha]|uniref:RING-type E3 ubiquitin transferase n=1 Tax=Dreissena polymorpha TaxID=45954 RepID=A0A9D4LDI5_DREPO|nr:hypothetical protein DPMN_098685 [Dreissena polymorpha]
MADQDHFEQEGKRPPNESKRKERRQKTTMGSNAQCLTSSGFKSQSLNTPDQTSGRPTKKESIGKKPKNQSQESTDSPKPPPEATHDKRFSQHPSTDFGGSLRTPSLRENSGSSKELSSTYHTGSDSAKSNSFAASSRTNSNSERPGVHTLARQSSKSALNCKSQSATTETDLGSKMIVGNNADVSRNANAVSMTDTCAAPVCAKKDDTQGNTLSEMLIAKKRISLTLKMPSERKKKRIRVVEDCCLVDALKWKFISERMLQDVDNHIKNMYYNPSLHFDEQKMLILRIEHPNEVEAVLFTRHLIWDILIKFSNTLIYVCVDDTDMKLDSFQYSVQVYDNGKLFIVCDRRNACHLTDILGKRSVTVLFHVPMALRKYYVKCIDVLPCEGSDQTCLNYLISGTMADVLPKIASFVPYYVLECTFIDQIREHICHLDIAGELDGILNDANLTCVTELINNKAYVYGFAQESVIKGCELVQANVIICEKTLPPMFGNSECAKVLSEHKSKAGGKYVLYMRKNNIVAIGLAKAIENGFNCETDRLAKESGTACGNTSQSHSSEPLEGASDTHVKEEYTTDKGSLGGIGDDTVKLSSSSTQKRLSAKQKSDNIRMWEIESKRLILNMNRVDKIDTAYVLTRPQTSERDDIEYTPMEDGRYCMISIPDAKSSSMKILLDRYRNLFAVCKKYKMDKIALSLEEINGWPFSKFSKVVIKAALDTLEQGSIDSTPREIILCEDSKRNFESAIKIIDKMIKDKGCQTHIVVVADHIERTEADVIVNSTSRQLDLKKGKVSKALLDAAGPQIQKECRARYPNGLGFDTIAVTKGYELKCQHVLHIALDVFNNETSRDCLESIKNIILRCLHWANDQQMTSIAFPALGTGKLKYPPYFVCNAMFDSVKAFRTIVTESMKDSTLLTVKLIVHPDDHDILELYTAFAEKHVQKTIQKSEEIKPDMQGTLNACQLVVIDIPEHTFAASKYFFCKTWSEIEATGVQCSHDHDGKLSLTGTEKALVSAEEKVRGIISKLQSMTYRRFSGKLSSPDTRQISNLNGVLCYEHKFTKVKDVYTENSEIMKRIESLMNDPIESSQRRLMENNCDKNADNEEKQESKQIIIQSPEEEVKCQNNSMVAATQRPANELAKDVAMLDTQTGEMHLKDNSCIHVNINNDLDNDSVANTVSITPQYINTVRVTTQYTRQTSTSSNSSVKDQVELADKVSTEGDMKLSRGRSGITIQGRFKINGISVVICHGDILEVKVDCIVNAANKDLQHNGGIAGSIAAAAGNAIWDESEIIIRERGPLATGDVVMTRGGNLPVCILHAVGPCWYDYDRSNVLGIKKCVDDLKKTVLNCLEYAATKGYAKIAFPSLSSGLFKVPEELCAVQYANAVLSFKRGDRVHEILFVDINLHMTKLIVSTFDVLKRQNKTIGIDCNTYIEKPTKSDQHEKGAKCYDNLPSSSCIYEGLLTGSVSLNIHIGDITRLNGVQMVVCSDNKAGSNAGSIARQLYKLGGDSYRHLKANAFHERQGKLGIGDVVITDGGKLSFEMVMHVIVPQDQMPEMHYVYRRLFKEASVLGVSSVAVPLLGTAQGNFSADGSISALLIELEKFSMKYQRTFKVHVVIGKEDIGLGIRDIVEKFVKDLWESRSKDSGEVSGKRVPPADTRKDDVTGSGHGSIKKGSAEASLKPQTKTYKTILTAVGNALLRKRQESVESDGSNDHFEDGRRGSIKRGTAEASLTTADNTIATVVNPKEKLDDCVICMDVPSSPKTLKCGHTFCNDCIKSLFKIKPSCPICGAVCGVICGDQPNGSMIIEKQASILAGFEKHDTISICYRFHDSQQGPNHPKPGAFVRGITRIGYVPDNNEGRQVCAMLAVAFQRRLVFTIGSSRTTGEEGVITWNDIHHKTDLRPNTQFGYPDPTYLQRVREELAAKGVTEEDVKSLDKQTSKFIKKGKHGAKAIVHTCNA